MKMTARESSTSLLELLLPLLLTFDGIVEFLKIILNRAHINTTYGVNDPLPNFIKSTKIKLTVIRGGSYQKQISRKSQKHKKKVALSKMTNHERSYRA